MTHVREGRRRTMVRLAAACGLLTAIFAGCGRGGPERAVVAGAVTYQGQPLPNGTIYFIPCDEATGPLMVTAIAGGQYKMDTWGGLPVGDYRVHIEAAREDPAGEESRGTVISPSGVQLHRRGGQYIPAKYNTNTELKLTVKSGSGSMKQDFALSD
jgi:hypothetical protein